MAAPEILSCIFHKQDPLIAPRRSSDDLPTHVKGIIRWYPDAQPIAGYYIPKKYSPSREFEPVEFINNRWFILFRHQDTSTTHLCTKASEAIPIINRLGIGYWDITDPQHPDFTPSNPTPINVDPPENTVLFNPPTPQTHYNTPTPGLTIATTSIPQNIPTSQTTTIVPTRSTITMSASATGTGGQGGGGGAPAAALPTPSNGGMRGIPPAIFDGTHALADEFWAQFR